MHEVYYNEWEKYPAAWLRNLMLVNEIPDGVVDETDIRKIKAEEIATYKVCHFFAGIGGWPLALKLARWPEDREIWTGSCPCQPFSVAGKQKGKDDDRHLWPAWFDLIKQRRPATIFGEQVTGAITHGWFDEVAQGLEAEGYAVASAIIPACGIGAPHKRDRLWFVANTADQRRQYGTAQRRSYDARNKSSKSGEQSCTRSQSETLGNTTGDGREQRWPEPIAQRETGRTIITNSSMANPNNKRPQGRNGSELSERANQQSPRESDPSLAHAPSGGEQSRSPQRYERGFQETFLRKGWNTHDWNVEPAVGRVANGISARSHKLRAYGNAIVPQVAAAFIRAFLEAERDL